MDKNCRHGKALDRPHLIREVPKLFHILEAK